MRLFALIIAAALFISLSACDGYKNRLLNVYDTVVEAFGEVPITPDILLIGKRDSEDSYTGIYTADCDRKTGRDVVFGGTSVEPRVIYITAMTACKNGYAAITVESGGSKRVLSPDGSGVIEAEVTVSGSFYVTVFYEGFSGTVVLKSSDRE